MAYDDTSFYGDRIFDEYDDKNNFIGTTTPSGFYVYHILGDGFDIMSEQCSKFLNDCSILSADASSLDSYWGLSYNMPRPLLYEGQKAEYLFEDLTGDLTKYSGADSRVTTSSANGVITLTWVSGTYLFWANADGSTEFDYTGDFTVEFDVVSNGQNSSIQIYDNSATIYYSRYMSVFNSNCPPCHFKIVKDGQIFRTYIDGVEKSQGYVESNITQPCRVGFRSNTNSSFQFRNFKIYRGEDKERPLNDDEYRVYLYLRNCRLLTREDLLINMGKCFGLDDYEIVLSDEAFYLESSDHPNYEAEDTISSNLHKRDDDTTLHFVTDFANDETTELIEGGLSEQGELMTVINIPFNNWDSEFLEFMEQFVSVKGNLKIKEYHL